MLSSYRLLKKTLVLLQNEIYKSDVSNHLPYARAHLFVPPLGWYGPTVTHLNFAAAVLPDQQNISVVNSSTDNVKIHQEFSFYSSMF
jgi:hypothetical protein